MNQSADPENFGIRVSLPEGDPFARLLDDNWNTYHWFASRTERDRVLADMRREHEYSRDGDKPTLIFDVIDRDSGTT